MHSAHGNQDYQLNKQKNESALSPEEKIIIDAYFQDSLNFILKTYHDRKGKAKNALKYIVEKKTDSSLVSLMGNEYEKLQNPSNDFQEYGI